MTSVIDKNEEQGSPNTQNGHPVTTSGLTRPIIEGSTIDELIGRSSEGDELVAFVSKFWKQIAFVFIAAVLLAFATRAVLTSRQEQSAASADLFAKVRSNYQSFDQALTALVALTAEQRSTVEREKKEQAVVESERKFKESVRVLGDARQPYPQIASLYQTLAQVQLQRAAALIPAIVAPVAPVVAASPGSSPAPTPSGPPLDLSTITIGVTQIASFAQLDLSKIPLDSGERFFAELAMLTVAKSFLDAPTTLEQGRALLKKLAEQGTIVAPSAAISYAVIAKSPEERVSAKSLLESVVARFPEQREVLDGELKRLGA